MLLVILVQKSSLPSFWKIGGQTQWQEFRVLFHNISAEWALAETRARKQVDLIKGHRSLTFLMLTGAGHE